MTDTGIPGIEEKSLDPRHLAPFEDAHGFFRQTVSIGEKLESGVRRVEGVNFSARESLYVLAAWVEAAKEHNSPFGPSSCFTLCCRTRISSRRGRDWERLQESVGYGQTGGGARLPRKRETCHSRSGVQFRKARKRDVRVAGRCVAEAEQCTLPARAGGVGHGGAALLLSDGRARPSTYNSRVEPTSAAVTVVKLQSAVPLQPMLLYDQNRTFSVQMVGRELHAAVELYPRQGNRDCCGRRKGVLRRRSVARGAPCSLQTRPTSASCEIEVAKCEQTLFACFRAPVSSFRGYFLERRRARDGGARRRVAAVAEHADHQGRRGLAHEGL